MTSVLPHAERVATTVLPTRHGRFAMIGYVVEGVELVVLGVGLDEPEWGVLPWVRIHSECLTGDALGSLRCDCGEQLQAALAAIMEHGYGAVVYARGHEGRGIGLMEKLRAYALQDAGWDTLDANLELGHPADARRYDAAAAVLVDLGLTRIAMLSSNPAKEEAVEAFGIEVVQRFRLGVPDRPENVFYLNTKRERMRHDSAPTDVVPATQLTGAPPEVYEGLVAAGPQLVIAQLAQSLDGFIASRTGDSMPISGPEDHRHLHRLRSLVDAVVVGAATVLADDPRLTVREVPGASPVRVVLDVGTAQADADAERADQQTGQETKHEGCPGGLIVARYMPLFHDRAKPRGRQNLMTLTYDLYWSFRSPYSYMIMHRLTALERDYDVACNVRPSNSDGSNRGCRTSLRRASPPIVPR